MCRPTRVKLFCKKCCRFYSVTYSDCRPARINYSCPRCRSDDYEIIPDDISRIKYLEGFLLGRIKGKK